MNSDNVPLLGTRPSIAPRPRTLRVPPAPETPLGQISPVESRPAEAASLTTTRLPTIFPTRTGGAPIDSGRKFTTHIVSIALGVLLFFSALLNVAQYQHGQSPMARAALGDGRYAMHAVFTLEKPSKHGKCAEELVHMCVDSRSATLAAPSSLGAAASVRDWEVRGNRAHLGWTAPGVMHGVLSLVHPTHGKCTEEQGLVRMCVDKRSAALASTN